MSDPALPETMPELPQGNLPRNRTRTYVGQIVIVVSVMFMLGAALKQKAMISANDISRWCTVWALLEEQTYAIDECPWQLQTQDKVFVPDPYRTIEEEPERRFISSKPPLLPTIIAGILYPVRAITGVELDSKIAGPPRTQRKEVQSIDDTPPEDPSKIIGEDEEAGYRIIDITSENPPVWPINVLYFNPILILLNVVPTAVMLILFARLLDRYAKSDWAWIVSLVAAGLGTNLVAFSTTLNNHTVAAWSAFFAVFAMLAIWDGEKRGWWTFASAGFFGAFAACNEIPAAAFGVLLFLMVLIKSPAKTFTAFIPAAAIPVAGFLITLYFATGDWRPWELSYTKFNEEGDDSPYRYPGSYWLTPLGTDWFDQNPEPWPTYLFHLLVGHHGIFSLTPIFLFSLWGLFRSMVNLEKQLRIFSWLTFLLSTAIIAFYVWRTHNYGGATQGMRWLFWLFPFWLIALPNGVEGGARHSWLRWLILIALGFSVLNTGYAVQQPWSHPWILDMLEHLGLYELKR